MAVGVELCIILSKSVVVIEMQKTNCYKGVLHMIWYVVKNGRQKEMPEEVLIYKIQNGEIEPNTLVMNAEIKNWIVLEQTSIWAENALVFDNQIPQSISQPRIANLEKVKRKNKILKIAFTFVLIAFIMLTGILCVFTKGLMNNILITLVACIFPAAAGIGLNFLGNFLKENKNVLRFLHIFGSVFRCICPAILMVALWWFALYNTSFTRSMVSIIALSICFLGYIPAHYNPHYSLMKNNLLGIINLFSIVFMWSFVSGTIGVSQALTYATQNRYAMEVLLFKVGSMFILLQALKLIVEEFDDIRIVKAN